MKVSPRLIVVEGTTCSGKTTLAKSLEVYIENSLYMKMLPSDTERGHIIKKQQGMMNPLETDILYLDDLCKSAIEAEDNINKGYVVIMDRYLPSLLSFCERYREKDDFEIFSSYVDHGNILQPDIIFYLHASTHEKSIRATKKEDFSTFDQQSLNDNLLEEIMKKNIRIYDTTKIEIYNSKLDKRQTLDYAISYLI